MNNNEKYFLELLSAFLKKSVPKAPGNIEWDKIYYLSRIHFLSGAVYLSIQKLDEEKRPEPYIYKKFKSDFLNTILRYEKQEKSYEEITKKLNENRIKHVFFKGSVIRKYYPAEQMRTLGDIDFLVHKEDVRRVDKALLEIGYKKQEITTSHIAYGNGNVHIEVHDKIMNGEINRNADYIEYFQNVWNNVSNKDNSYKYNINIEYHLLYLIAHIAKHFYECGSGIRMFLDIAVIIDKFGDTIDFVYLCEELKKLKLYVFARNIFELCIRYFKVYVPNINLELDDKTFELISDYILKGGTFGFNNRNLAIRNIRQEYDKTANHRTAEIKVFWGKIFLNYREMANKYCILGKLPFLLPFLWIFRGFECIIIKPKKTLSILKGFLFCTDEAEKSYEVIKRIGLSKL